MCVVADHLLTELVELFTDESGLLLLSLCLLDVAYGILDLAVSFFQQFLGLFLGPAQNRLALAFYLLDACVQSFTGGLQSFLMLMDGLTFAFPVAFVAHDVLQVFVALYVVGADNLRGIVDDFFGNPRLTGYLDGKRGTRLAYRQLEEGLHPMTVVEHGTIHNTFMVLSKVLKILVVCGDDGKGLFLPELFQHGFSDGAANSRFGAASKLVDE